MQDQEIAAHMVSMSVSTLRDYYNVIRCSSLLIANLAYNSPVIFSDSQSVLLSIYIQCLLYDFRRIYYWTRHNGAGMNEM